MFSANRKALFGYDPHYNFVPEVVTPREAEMDHGIRGTQLRFVDFGIPISIR